MNGIWILLLIILCSSLPAILVFFWLKSKKSAVTLPWFLVSLAAGIISFLLAALIHDLFFPEKKAALWPVLFTIFVRIALVEESSRVIVILPFLKVNKNPQHKESSFGAALGLVAGLGFAVIESAYHGITNLNITILRLFTAAPLHGACGIRAGTAVFKARQYPLRALLLFASTILIHGTYNLIIVSPAYPSVLAALISFAAFFSSLSHLKASNTNEY